VQFRSFELDPSAPATRNADQSYVERLAAKYESGVAAAQAMVDRMTDLGAQKGIAFDFDRIQVGNTFAAHQLLHWSLTQQAPNPELVLRGPGAHVQLKERLLRAYFCEGEAIGDVATLVRLAGSIGLSEEHAHDALVSGSFVADARGDEEAARQLGISGVPFFVIGHYGVSGAQPVEVLASAVNRGWAELA